MADSRTGSLSVSARLTPRHGTRALDVRLEAPPGITALLGPSGSGKSSTLAAIAGLLRPECGRIAIGEETWFDSGTKVDVSVHRRRLAFVFQSLALFPHLTAAGNVAYGIDRRFSARDRRAQACRWLERFRVSHLADRKPSTYSGGEAQRVALARALARTPQAVLLDEPFSALDRPLRRQLAAEIANLLRELAVPVVLVTHDGEEARSLGDRFVILNQGVVVRSGCIGDLRDA